MAKVCPISGKKSAPAGKYSNRTRATQFNPTRTKRRQSPNFQRKKIFVPELDKTFTLTISTTGIKTIEKKGAFKALRDAGIITDKHIAYANSKSKSAI
jgi:large subunit ribosomal protein L28